MNYSEEESKRARILQREKRQELQLIIERCNQIDFDYVKVPSERNDNFVFGSSKPRRIYLYAEDKTVNSFMRRCFKEEFKEPAAHIKEARKLPSEEVVCETEQKPSAIFASKVPRFQETLASFLDSSQGYRRKKKVQETVQAVKVSTVGFSSKSPRNLMCTRDIKLTEVPTCSYVPPNPNKKYDCIQHSFGGRITFSKTYDIVCSPKIIDPTCHDCCTEPKNVYWKNHKTHTVLCRNCYNKRLFNIKNKSRGVVEKHKTLQKFERDFKKKRQCSFFHQHNGTKAAILLLTPEKFLRQRQKENFLNTFMKF